MVFHKRCLICYVKLRGSEDGSPEESEVDTSSGKQFLAKDLNAIFILRNLLEVPSEQLETYLEHGNPSEWTFVRFCVGCGEMVDNAKKIYQEILDASRVFASIKGEIVNTVKNSWRTSSISNHEVQVPLGSSRGEAEKTRRMVEETREFVVGSECFTDFLKNEMDRRGF